MLAVNDNNHVLLSYKRPALAIGLTMIALSLLLFALDNSASQNSSAPFVSLPVETPEKQHPIDRSDDDNAVAANEQAASEDPPGTAEQMVLLNDNNQPADFPAPTADSSPAPAVPENPEAPEATASLADVDNPDVDTADEPDTAAQTDDAPRKILDSQWIAKQPIGNHTIQVIASYRLEDINNFAKAEDIDLPMAIYQTRRSGRTWYGLVLGSYSSYQQAKEQTDNLPKKWHRFEPWIRPFSQLPR